MSTHQITKILKADRRTAGDLSYLKVEIMRADTGASTVIDLRSRKGEAQIPVDGALTTVTLPDDFFAGRDADAAHYRSINREKNISRLAELRRQAEAEANTGSRDAAMAQRVIAIIDAGLSEEELNLMAQDEGNTHRFPVEKIVLQRAQVM